ncbi:glucuronate isomerase [Flavobacteriaceae bacterium MHTCC 0001]
MNFSKHAKLDLEGLFLNSETAKTLYHEFAKKMPIVDYHNHLPAKMIAENEPIGNITKAWLLEDHYKWRALRANGIDENFITGTAPAYEKFEKWAETVPFTVGNPLFHWNQLELKRYFDIDTLLQPNSAKEVYDKANEILKSKTPAQLLEDMQVKIACTTDDPADDLKYHKQIAEGDFYTKVLPTFRSDALFLIDDEGFAEYLKKIESCVGFEIKNLSDFLKAIDSRIDFFEDHGCKLSDYGVGSPLYVDDYTEAEVESIFESFLKGEKLQGSDISKYKSFVLDYLAGKYHEKSWTQQYHLGALRNNNRRLKELRGADTGTDSISDYSYASSLSKFLNRMDYKGKLAKTITYNLNPAHNEVFATMMGNFSSGEYAGKMQWGAAWWFLDQKEGIENQLTCLSNLGLLSRSVGFLTDSRSFLSFPRHEYFRRILCNFIGKQIEQGSLPNDINFFGKIVENICYHNSIDYFDF